LLRQLAQLLKQVMRQGSRQPQQQGVSILSFLEVGQLSPSLVDLALFHDLFPERLLFWALELLSLQLCRVVGLSGSEQAPEAHQPRELWAPWPKVRAEALPTKKPCASFSKLTC